jgi:hypothetical protein
MINTTRLRCWVGWLGALLPLIVVVLLWRIPESISATYYEPKTVAPFMIILGMAAALLIAYEGYDLQDDIVNTLAGVSGLLICLFPCGSSEFATVGTFQVPQDISGTIHNVAAVLFFGLLAYNSLFLFTKHGEQMTPEKKKRNVVYRVCGVGMVASFALLLLPRFRIQVWLVETLALFFFAASWLTKADRFKCLFADKKERVE